MSISQWKSFNAERHTSVFIVLVCSVSFMLSTSNTRQCAAQAVRQTDEEEIIEPHLLMFREPDLAMPPVIYRLPRAYLTLWIEALSGPEQELKRDVAFDISRAHRDGYLDCSTAADALLKALQDHKLARSVRVEIARALITLDSRKSSNTLQELLIEGSGTQFEMLVEPVLAQWHDARMLTVWRQRITERDVPRYRQLLAIRALAELPSAMTSNAELHQELINLVATCDHTAVMLEATQTLGIVKRSGLEHRAEKLLQSIEANGIDRLAGVYLLLHHSSDSSRKLLMQAITDGLPNTREAPLVRTAWTRLLELNAAELVPLTPQAVDHADPEIRRVAIETIRHFATGNGVKLLGHMLNDRHPEVRRAARQALLQLSGNDSLKDAVRLAGMKAVAGTSWQAQEQAIMLLAILKQSAASDRLLELLPSARADVAIAAAWGLKHMNVSDNSAALLEFAETLDQQLDEDGELRPHLATVLAHLFEAFGKTAYEPAVPLLKRWVPKQAPRINLVEARSAAVWALGRIFEDSQDETLAAILKERLLDIRSLEPELFSVRYSAAIAMGRIGARSVAGSMKSFALSAGNEIDLASAWAIRRLTGEVVPPPKPLIEQGNHWKLLPIGSRRELSAKDSDR